tara:strand:+ start:284 stop:691 length:408 start_codon:yes stop_codon:yes gene_type:complete
MGLKRTKLLGIQAVTGINTVGILTVGVTPTAGGVGIASTTYLRGVVMHNTGIGTATSSLYIYPDVHTPTALGVTANRLARVDLNPNETFFFEANYPIVLTDRETVVVEVTKPATSVGGLGIGSAINYQILGDTDI